MFERSFLEPVKRLYTGSIWINWILIIILIIYGIFSGTVTYGANINPADVNQNRCYIGNYYFYETKVLMWNFDKESEICKWIYCI